MFRKAALSMMLGLVLCLAATAQAQKGIPVPVIENEVDELIRNLRLGEPVYYRNLTVIPIYLARIKSIPNYLTLDEVVRKRFVTITEVNGGQVPQVRVDNNSDRIIFFMSGEIITGGKQDRFVGEDLLLGPWRKGVILPVYCSERGRWTFTSDKFASDEIIAAPSLRQKIIEKKEQAEIWDGIREESRKLGVSSSTEAFKDVYKAENVEKEMSSYRKKFELVPQLHRDTIGVAVGVHGRIVAIDIFSNPDLFARLWPKLLKSYALNALGPELSKFWWDARGETKEILNKIYRAGENRWNGLDLGETIKINVDNITASALVYNRDVVHLSVLAPEVVIFRKGEINPPPIPPDTIPVIE